MKCSIVEAMRTARRARVATCMARLALSGLRIGASGILVGAPAGFLACASPDVSSPSVPTPDTTFWALTLQSHAITMSIAAPYDTLQLVATPRSALGAPLVGAPTPRFVTTDSSVRVSPTGLLTARAVRGNVKVIAELTYQGVRHADTAVITVTDPAMTVPHPAARLVLRPETGEDATLPVPTQFSLFYSVFPFKMLEAEVQDTNGAVISEALLALTTSAPGAVTLPMGRVQPSGSVELDFDPQRSRVGVVTVSASATVYGVTVTDTLALTLTTPRLMIIQVAARAASGRSAPRAYTAAPAGTVTIAAGGTVWWQNLMGSLTDSLDVVFDNPSAAAADAVFNTGGGDIPTFPGAPDNNPFLVTRARQFPQAGSFPWHSPKTGLSGTIVVQ